MRAGLEQVGAGGRGLHGVRVEMVMVGDCPLDERLQALIAAAREALINAAKFAGAAQIDLYAEAGDERVEVFVRDRGVGFDLEAIPADRQGIRQSIRERMGATAGWLPCAARPGRGPRSSWPWSGWPRDRRGARHGRRGR